MSLRSVTTLLIVFRHRREPRNASDAAVFGERDSVKHGVGHDRGSRRLSRKGHRILKNEEDLQDHDDQNVTPDWITQEQPMPYNRLPPLATTSIPANTSFRLRDDPTRYLAAHDLRYNGSEEKTKKKRKRKKKREKKAEKDEGSEFVNSMRSDDIEFNLNDTHTELNGEISRKGDKSSTDV
ncbi:hypothetical protein MAR_016837 [Mya arenaria]|uniref:Uncharacterized protein n=1 Tax=Mya arenaria TaxID=6604 RepID=A0ABY7ECN8_MYAAR|nr:hypothetical protein MAR_016837 [Mya arenaria]